MTDDSAVVALARKLGFEGETDEDLLEFAPRTFSQDTRDKLAKKKQAMPGGGFPIPDVDALKRAIQSIGRAKNPEATKAYIKKRAAALGASDLIPENW